MEDFRLKQEAPGDLLSGLLAVSAAELTTVKAGSVRDLPAAPGQWRLISPEAGRLRLAWEDRAWVLEPRQAAAFCGGEELSLLPLEDGRLRLVCLSGSAADTVLGAGGRFYEHGGLALERLLRLLAARQPSPKEASEYAYQLLMALYGTAGDAPEEGERLLPVVEAALGLIRRDFAFLDGIGELADRLEVSQEYLTRCFCRAVGVTPGRYLTQVRIENAKLLLRQGGHSVQFVSDACGFSNGNYFARVFRASVGMNPRDYARRSTGPDAADQSREDTLYVL